MFVDLRMRGLCVYIIHLQKMIEKNGRLKKNDRKNGQLKKIGEWKEGLKDGKWEHYLENGNKTDFGLFSKGNLWMVLEFDRFGVVKDHEEEIKFNEMLKNKSSIEASQSRKGRRKLRRKLRKEKAKLKKKKEAGEKVEDGK